MTHHLDWTVFLFAHTSEVLDLLAFILVFVAATQTVARDGRGPSRVTRPRPGAVAALGLVAAIARCRMRRGCRFGHARPDRSGRHASLLPLRSDAITVPPARRSLDEQRPVHALGPAPEPRPRRPWS